MKEQQKNNRISILKTTNYHGRLTMRKVILLLISSLTILSMPLFSDAIDDGDLFTFQTGDPASSSQVNSNFDVVQEAVNLLDLDVIKGVTAGSGLTGGGSSGDVTINVGTGAITTAHLGTNSVGADEIAAGAVGTSEIADGSVTGTDIANGTITGTDVSSYSIPGLARKAGYQVTGFTTNISITSSTSTSLGYVTVSDTWAKDVSLTAHCVIEIPSGAAAGGQFEFSIRRGSKTGTIVGRAWWRIPATTVYHSVTICFTGWDSNISSAQTYYLCANKFSGAPPNVNGSVSLRGIVADWTRR